jgi:hypothetical protein
MKHEETIIMNENERILIINSCESCPNRWEVLFGKDICKRDGSRKYLDYDKEKKYTPIPEWCPLPKAENNEKKSPLT